MKPYFRLLKRRAKLIKVADSWLGTPYHHMWHTKGRGADCSLFIAECFKECGIVMEFNVAYYPTDWHIHTNTSLIEETIHNSKMNNNLSFIEVEDIMFGDLLLFTFVSTKIPHHIGLMLNDNIIIQAGIAGVDKVDFDKRWKRHLVKIYRVVEK